MHILEFYMSVYTLGIYMSRYLLSSEVTVVTIKIMMMKWCWLCKGVVVAVFICVVVDADHCGHIPDDDMIVSN